MLAPVVATWLQGPLDEVPRWMTNPVSFKELSFHARLIWLEEAAAAVRVDGATGLPGLPAWPRRGNVRHKTPMKSNIGNSNERTALRRAERVVVGLDAFSIDARGRQYRFIRRDLLSGQERGVSAKRPLEWSSL